MVLESELPSLMVTMCMYDSESYVRASAIKCLQEMIKVPAFWHDVLDQEDLPVSSKKLYTFDFLMCFFLAKDDSNIV